ncbi:MAG: 4'-phosphopantetheinyl transferase superfamily protein [Saprospiraceae bacterium]|nr:4'-phosphopantetheinyl transferase superfamily protein [Saprospiraceae bacterium]
MPQIFHFQDSEYQLGIWKIEEPEDFFIDGLHEEQSHLPELTPPRRLQSLAARFLLTQMLETDNTILKNAWNQPFIKNDQRYLSISHSFEMAAVLVGHRAGGIDIEKKLPRLQRIASKFLKPIELERLNGPEVLSQLYRIWGAKEAMFKAYGLGQIDFKRDLIVDLDALLNNKKAFTGRLLNHPDEISFNLHWFEIEPDYMVVYGSVI